MSFQIYELIHAITRLKSRQVFFLLFYRIFRFKRILSFTKNNSTLRYLKPSRLNLEKTTRITRDQITIGNLNINLTINDLENYMNITHLNSFTVSYFDWLDHSNVEFIDIDLHFIKLLANKRGANFSWHPYVSSLRMVNLLKWVMRFGDQLNEVAREEVNLLIAVHVSRVYQRLELDIDANHLFENLRSLSLVEFLSSSEKGHNTRGFLSLLENQFTHEGLYYEKSTVYNFRILFALCEYHEIIVKSSRVCKEDLRFIENTISRLRRAINKFYLAEPIFYYNDSMPQILNFELADILDKGKEINVPARISINYDHCLGLCRMTSGMLDLFVDDGRIRPWFQSGHCHSKFAEVILNINDKRVITTGATTTYEDGSLRFIEKGQEQKSNFFIKGSEIHNIIKVVSFRACFQYHK